MRELKINKINILAFLLAVLILLPAVVGGAENNRADEGPDIQVYFNQNRIDFSTEPAVIEGRLVIPIRSFLETMGSAVQWDEEKMQVVTRHKDSTITIYLEDGYAKINGSKVEMDPSATVVNGSTMVPLRFLAECLELSLDWDADARVIEVTTNNFVPYTRIQEKAISQLPDELENWTERRTQTPGVDVNVHESCLYILVTYGEKDSGGYGVQVTNLEVQEGNLFVEVDFVKPESGQFTFTAITRPFDLICVDLEHMDLPQTIHFDYQDQDQDQDQDDDDDDIYTLLPSRLQL